MKKTYFCVRMNTIKDKSIVELARDLRRNQTLFEKMLWNELRNCKLDGFKLLRQHALFYYSMGKRTYLYFADFYCAEKGLVIELDGKIHDYRKEQDNNRETVLRERGVRIIRIKNEELDNMENVLLTIKTEMYNSELTPLYW